MRYIASIAPGAAFRAGCKASVGHVSQAKPSSGVLAVVPAAELSSRGAAASTRAGARVTPTSGSMASEGRNQASL
jgi:hypothetical protein